ncbi:cyclic-di-AMP receptor [Phytoplasma sp.]|uniref:cyclic-di-AMP receptor n=1 Tax=Phytoplasma sp. TaxID=2155 RepID=UPI002B404EEC|nr:cyclic-di-AMP receptor [Phytoplasma sp.]
MNMDNEMKLILAIISNEDANKVQNYLNEYNFFHTRLDIKGGFLKENNTTFIIGLKKEKVDQVLEIFKEHSQAKTQLIPKNDFNEMSAYSDLSSEITIGGTTVFVLNIEKFLQI